MPEEQFLTTHLHEQIIRSSDRKRSRVHAQHNIGLSKPTTKIPCSWLDRRILTPRLLTRLRSKSRTVPISHGLTSFVARMKLNNHKIQSDTLQIVSCDCRVTLMCAVRGTPEQHDRTCFKLIFIRRESGRRDSASLWTARWVALQ